MEAEVAIIIAGIVIIIILMFVNLIILNGKKDALPPPTALEIGQALKFPTTAEIAASLNIPTTEDMRTALGASFTGEGGFSERIGAFTTLSSEMTEATKSSIKWWPLKASERHGGVAP